MRQSEQQIIMIHSIMDCYTKNNVKIHESVLIYMGNSIHKLILKREESKINHYSKVTTYKIHVENKIPAWQISQ